MNDFIRQSGPWGPLIVLGVAIAATFIITGVWRFVIAKAQKLAAHSTTSWDDVALHALAGLRSWAVFVWITVALLPLLGLHESVEKAGRTTVVIVSAIQFAIMGLRAVTRWRERYLQARLAVEEGTVGEGNADMSIVAAIGLVATAMQGVLLIVVLLIALSNLGIDVMALVTGLGIGGIAVALAAQNVLGDIFASLSIVLDKPFVIGDSIAVGDRTGTVENIGLKTTRIRSLSGEQLVFSNKDLLESRVQNFKRMWERRVVQKIGVTYSTSADNLERIPEWIKGMIDADPTLRFDRCHMSGYGDSSIDFEFVFFVLSSEFNVFMDHQQTLLLKIFRKFADEKIEFAFPSRTLYLDAAALAALETSRPSASAPAQV